MNITIEDRIRKTFPCSQNHSYLGGYLMADGTNVDIRCIGYDHRNISTVFNTTKSRYRSGSGWYGVEGMLSRGHIRTSPESNGFEFMRKPTEAQIAAIREFVYENGCEESCYFERLYPSGREEYIGNWWDFLDYIYKKFDCYAS